MKTKHSFQQNRRSHRSKVEPLPFSDLVPFVLVTIFLDRVLYFLVDDYAIGFVRQALVQKVADRRRVVLKATEKVIPVLAQEGIHFIQQLEAHYDSIYKKPR